MRIRTFFAILLINISIVNLFADNKNVRTSSYNYLRGVESLQKGNEEEAVEYLNNEIEENPKNGYAYSWLALIYAKQNEYGRALTAVNQAIKYTPQKDKEYIYFAYETRAEIFGEIGDTISSLNDYSMAVKICPEKEDAYKKRAQIYYEQRNYTLSDEDYNKLISINQGNVLGYMGLGRNFIAQKKWNDAIELFSFVAKLHPQYSSAYSFRAEAYLGAENWDHATDDLLTSLKIDNNDKAFFLMQDLDDKAFVLMKTKFQIQATKDPNEACWPSYIGIMLERKKQFESAISFYMEANKRDSSPYYLERIANCYDDLYEYEDCLRAINEALNMEYSNRSLLSLKANTLYELGMFNEAIAQWDSILAKYPEYAWGYYRRGWFKEGVNLIDSAIEDFSIAITLDPGYVYSYESRANLYAILGKTDLANADYNKMIDLEKNSGRYRVSQYAFQALGNYDKAIEIMDSILAREPDRPGAHYEAACLYARMNWTEKALDYLEETLNMGYRRFSHISIDHDLDNLRDMPRFKEIIDKHHNISIKNSPTTVKEPSQDSSAAFTVEIPFNKEKGNSLYRVKCSINELPLYFIFDTGASDVSLSQIEATFMMKNGYLDESDIVGNHYFKDAVGNINVGTTINLRRVNFGGMMLENVKASVVKNQKAPLLLGQSVLGRLGKIEIDNGSHVIRIFKNE